MELGSLCSPQPWEAPRGVKNDPHSLLACFSLIKFPSLTSYYSNNKIQLSLFYIAA